MRKRLCAAALVTAAIVIPIGSAMAGGNGAGKVPLVHFGFAFCTSGLVTAAAGDGFAVINQSDGKVSTEIALKGGLPNTTYNVRLIQTPGGADCFDFDGTLTTNGNGNGNAHISEPVAPGSTGAFVDLSSEGIAGDYYNTLNVSFS